MRRHLVRLSVALLTFIVGVTAATLWLERPRQPAADGEAINAVTAADTLPILYGPTHCTSGISESPEEKAVRLAEEFVARNGYTDLPPDRFEISYEGSEWAFDFDEMMRRRHDTLERKAYGIRYAAGAEGKGWMVAFRHTSRSGRDFVNAGRVVSMDEDFENLRVEHKTFSLGNVHKKF